MPYFYINLDIDVSLHAVVIVPYVDEADVFFFMLDVHSAFTGKRIYLIHISINENSRGFKLNTPSCPVYLFV